MKKIYINYWVICLMFVSLFSCNNDDDQTLFSETPAERIAQRNSELQSLLLSQDQGYKGVYFSKNDEFGGFTFYMKFNADGTVQMTSDFNSETAIRSSSYEVSFGTTTELVFTTRNHIQKLSETSGARLAGFRGTSVFQYFSNDNGVITFRDIRNRDTATLILEPTGFTDFTTESVVKAEASLAQRQNLLSSPTTSVFQLLRIENAGGTSNFNLNYNPENLYASPRITLDDGSVTEFNFGIAFTENGLIISPALEFEGETYTEFIYDETSSSYISTVNGTTASILFGNEPAFIGRDIESLAQLGPTGFLYRPRLGSNPLTSIGHDTLLQEISNNFDAAGLGAWTVREYQLIIDFNSDDCDTFLFMQLERTADQETFRAFYCFERGIINDRKLFLNYTGPISGPGVGTILAGNTAFFEPLVMPLIDFFNSSEGLIYTNEGGFSSTLFNFSNSAGTFTSIENPAIRVYGLWFG
ncbi:DUF4302 domain-containing protein [Flavivirga abyssicola]|uniref:DUF4302 domain-containing protein n=1 Tax=Flavivirga abyssicola TaxID=3063533 RepID=UPI0026DEE22A|nr:DUF4302 domain-containing protein [Flavivirga sp. MEBiC07777]WVK14073.1 DUF4302 domain-containing protein [Flavivirga sp. MEBiC07777]